MVKKYQEECEIYLSKSVNHEKYLQRVKKSTISIFDDKRCYIIETKSIQWNSYYQMVVKVKEYIEKTRQVKNNDKSKKYILRGQRNARYHEKILSNKKKSYNLT